MKWISTGRVMCKVNADANANAQTAFYTSLTANYNTDFAQFEGVTASLMSKLEPIVAAGPSQYGFSDKEDTSLRSTAIDSDAQATKNAQVAANQQITASNGGADLTPTGAQEQLKQEADIAGAQKLSSDEQSITQAGYTQGVQNYQTALGAEENVIGMMNPNSFASSATSGGNAATGAVNAAEAADNSWQTLVGGALGGATGALTSWALPKKP